MKRVFAISIAWLIGSSLMAQPAAGNFFVGGNFRIYTIMNKSKSGNTTHNDGSTTYLSIMPMGGYFLNEKIAVGAGLGVDSQIEKDPGFAIDKRTTTTFVINPFGRYYLVSGTGGLFAEASVRTAFGSYKTHSETTTNTENVMSFSALVSPGVYYYVTPKLALEAKFGWFGFSSYVTKMDNDDKDIQNTFGLNISPESFSFGLTYTL